MSTIPTTSITIVGDIGITVPESTKYMTTFILQEQGDWFEDEISFVRHFVKPGMKVIDIGANYGLYTLTMARLLGDSGKIWAFEPTAATAACLRESIENNGFSNVQLIQAGLSDHAGKAELFTSPNSELNSLTRGGGARGRCEVIHLVTLDQCLQEFGWNDIDFIKLDAEGEEGNILKQGENMLSSLSPLIMFELKHGHSVNLPLINQFGDIGYESYRLVPGLNVLVPFDADASFDPYLLNLFGCRKEQAERLEREGVLVRDWDPEPVVNGGAAQAFISTLLYGTDVESFDGPGEGEGRRLYMEALDLYATSLSLSIAIQDRVACLMGAMSRVRTLLKKGEQDIGRLAALARIAVDAGERAIGVRILSGLIHRFGAGAGFTPHELFLPAVAKYDYIDPENRIGDWLLSSVYEQCIRKHAYSSYYTKGAASPLFENLAALGFMDDDMRRRYSLVKTCYSA